MSDRTDTPKPTMCTKESTDALVETHMLRFREESLYPLAHAHNRRYNPSNWEFAWYAYWACVLFACKGCIQDWMPVIQPQLLIAKLEVENTTLTVVESGPESDADIKATSKQYMPIYEGLVKVKDMRLIHIAV